MKARLMIGLFLGLSFIQIATPLSMIVKREAALKDGEQFKFKTAPVDPYDAFRGRYVALRIEEDGAPAAAGAPLKGGQAVYALLTVDDQGFARIAAVTTVRPRQKSYIQTKVERVIDNIVYVSFPFDRYYMEEKAAPAAERLYLQQNQRGRQDAYVSVRIKDGFAVIENLYVGGKRIEDAVKQERKR